MKSWKETKENLEGSGTIFKLYLNSETFKNFLHGYIRKHGTPKPPKTTLNELEPLETTHFYYEITWSHPLCYKTQLKPAERIFSRMSVPPVMSNLVPKHKSASVSMKIGALNKWC